jgi:hypothetical protein
MSSNSSEGNYCYIAGYDAATGANFDVETGNDIITEAIQSAYCIYSGQNESYA